MKFITNLLLLFMPLFSYAQKISGVVRDLNNEVLPNVTVGIENTTVGTLTDEGGYYELSINTDGEYKLIFSYIGYETRKEVIVLTNQSVRLNLTLHETTEQLQTIEVIGRKEKDYKNTSSFIGTKSSTALKDVPQSISYVTKELMLDQAAFRLNDVVKNMSGVNQFSFYNDISIRGHRIQGGQNSSILMNGQRAYTSFWKQQLIPNIERVEVIKGPASAMFGNASAGGTINRVTKKPLREKYQSISTSVGSFETFRTIADLAGPLNDDKSVLYRMNLGYENSGSFRDLQYDKTFIIAPSMSFIPNDKTVINLDLVLQKNDTRLDRGQAVLGNGDLFSVPINTSLNSVNDFLKENSNNITLNFAQKLRSNLIFNASVMRSSYEEDLLEHRSANTYAKNGQGVNIPTEVEMQVFIRKRNFVADNLSTYINYDVKTRRANHKLLLGYDYAQQTALKGGSQLQARGYRNATNNASINSFDSKKPMNYLLDSKGNPVPNVPNFDLSVQNPYVLRDMSKYLYTVVNYDPTFLRTQGIYLQDQIQLGKWQALLGVRQDRYTVFENYGTKSEIQVNQSILIPRLGLVYSPNKNINAYATFVNGYQPQTASALSNPQAGGPFAPLVSELLEMGIKSEWLDKGLTVSAALYTLSVNGQLYNAGDAINPEKLIQIGKENSKGFEVDVIGKIASNWSLIMNYSFNDASIIESTNANEIGQQKPNAPKHQGNFWTRYTIDGGQLSGLGFALGSNFVTERFGSIVTNGQTPSIFPSYQLWNAGVYYSIKKVRLQMNFNNFTDKTHWVGGYDYLRAFPGAPRNWLGTVTYTF